MIDVLGLDDLDVVFTDKERAELVTVVHQAAEAAEKKDDKALERLLVHDFRKLAIRVTARILAEPDGE